MEIVLRRQDGSVWTSKTGNGATLIALSNCLKNKDLTPKTKALIERLMTDGACGVRIGTKDGKIKLLCDRPKCKVTIPLDCPMRKTVADGFEKLANGVEQGIVKFNDNVLKCTDTYDDDSNLFTNTTTNKTFEERAKQILQSKGMELFPNTVQALAKRLMLHGTLPSEML
jgi:hypothetical protein